MYKTAILRGVSSDLKKQIEFVFDLISENGSIFVLCQTEYNNEGCVQNDFMDIIKFGVQKGLEYINTIILPLDNQSSDNILYCVWFVKNREKMYFDKDKIREKHIWKDVEWGKRAKNYNPKGKDPGNVWIPTVDDGRAHIVKHIILSNFEIYDRLLSATLVKGDKFYLASNNDLDKKYTFSDNQKKTSIFKKHRQGFLDFGDSISFQDKSEEELSGIVVFDTAEKMSRITDRSVTTIVTSPPYWDLKNYYKKNQIGYQEKYETYCERMSNVWKECYRILKDTGSLWINVNIRAKNGKPILIPKDIVLQCQKIGFYYRGILIWHKSSGIPTNAKNLVDHHEYVLIFTKNLKTNIKRIADINYCDYKNPLLSNKLIWNINRKAGSVGKNTVHPAIFPTELINRIILISSQRGDVVVDPFLGSGTSLIAALDNGRNFVGYEFNEGFKSLMAERYKNEIKDKSFSIKYFDG